MIPTKEIIDSIDKDQLVDAVLEFGDNGYYPLELFLLKADYSYTYDDLLNIWNNVMDIAREWEDNHNNNSASLLADCTNMCIRHIEKLDSNERRHFCLKIVNDLTTASEEYGIGMSDGSEWIYEEERDKIKELIM